MANRQRAEARRKAAAKAARAESGAKPVMWIVAAAIVVVAIVVAVVVVSGGGDGGTASSTSVDGTSGTTATTSAGLIDGDGFPYSQPVTIEGESLTAYDSQAAFDDAVGTPAPTLSGKDFQGNEIVIDPAANGPYMIVFLAHWCPHCNAEVPRLLDWKNAGLVPAELNIIGVATAVAAEADNFPPAAWFSTKGWSWPVIVDEYTQAGVAGTAATAFGASGWPYFVIIGEDGLVKVRKSGELEVAELQAIVDEALAS
ncbi:MAG: hypothetical protein RJB61_163 [Actinomycetota bacterium]|jgi:cytochrome c biogenesis protein CcmG, thiol:disulfide interchange protein DsbE